MFNPFRASSKSGAAWFTVGAASSFPDLGLDAAGDPDNATVLSDPRPCRTDSDAVQPGCKVFHVPKTDSAQRTEVAVADQGGSADSEASEIGHDMADQVLVFRYRAKFHAIDHQCPHSSFPLSKGTPFDIEDFGIVLSAGLTCPKHGWSFDLFSGLADRGSYKLKIWEVQLRDMDGKQVSTSNDNAEDVANAKDQEVWVRRKQRMG
ncbi:Rieske [Lasiosphaeris hirsuta]|uniref:Rieske n=1 Tax=Lasiosphaeris hirsuta TaxID=260670 RepID=A0AA40E271_9PEZI|nr:Rieske [Lasiosphaeris hirsuta]